MALVAAALAATSCGKKSEVNTSKLEKSFQTVESSVKSTVTEAVTAVKNADYAGALAKLQKAASDAELTPEQKEAIQDVVEQIKAAMAATVDKAAEGASKAASDLQKSLSK